MARMQGTTISRGYGQQHRTLRDQLLAAWQPGDPCSRCGRPMLHRWMVDKRGRKVSAIDLGHVDGDKSRYNGLEHAGPCNRAAGGRRSGRIRRAKRQWITSRRW